ncbi:class I SAM-dependent rRNA methyltransferase [bacterium]|nr:class I SAM-dependent rRNA methyltransferase [bacterium]
MNPARVILKSGRERPVLNGNPWVYSGSVGRIEGLEKDGQPCEIVSSVGDFLATGYVNPQSRITCRILSRERVTVDRDFFAVRIRQALSLREGITNDSTNACRLINSEGDFLPGLIVDRYGDGVVVQFLTSGMEFFREDVLACIVDLIKPSFIVERSDSSARHDEGLETACRILSGSPGDLVEIVENALRFRVDLLNGQKTGFYLDQRDARRLFMSHTVGKRILNLFSYTGGFSVAAAAGGANEVTSVDSSGPALSLARENMALNGFGSLPGDYIKEDAFTYLNSVNSTWDCIVIDPPAFATKKTMVDKAARGYKDLNLRALKIMNTGGILATFSCSYHIGMTLFRQIVYAAVTDSGRQAQVIAQTAHQQDHPFNVCHIEGEYLKGIFLRVTG